MRGLAAACLLCSLVAQADQGVDAYHAKWTTVLEAYVDETGFVDYDGLLADRGTFDEYVAWLDATGPRTHPRRFEGRATQLAFYINAYNALVFEGVLARGPERKSVWRGLISGWAFFRGMDVRLDGEVTNLQTIEDVLIREGFADPRIHAALNCASVSCPRLPREAFQPATLEAQLDTAMREFVRDHVRFEAESGTESGTAYLSKIFDWFEEDFLAFEQAMGHPGPALINYVNRYRGADAQIPAGARVRFMDYDKGINAQPR